MTSVSQEAALDRRRLLVGRGGHRDPGSGGSDSATIPSAVAVALFACLATWPVAKYGFKHDGRTYD
jgi:hypothetical protein